MGYKIKTLPIVEKQIQKMFIDNQNRLDSLIKQIEVNPYVGDPLQIRCIREKRFNGKRIYFVVYEDLKAVLMVAISDKKTQQKTIDFIRTRLNEYRELLKGLLK